MRLLAAALIGLGAILASGANANPSFPMGATGLELQLLSTETADTRAWIKDEALREATMRSVDEETPRNAARKNGATGSEVSKLAFLVLMEAARAADGNVSTLVNGVQGDAASRQDIRQAQATDNVIAGSQQSQFSGGQQMASQAQGHAFVPLLSEGGDGKNPVQRAKDASGYVPPPTMNLQDAMDRENQIDDLLDQAMKQVAHPA